MKALYFIGGPMGVGKTAIAEQIIHTGDTL